MLLLVLARNTIPERLKSIVKKHNISLEEPLISYILLYKVGMRDSINQNIDIERIPEKVQKNPFYSRGYNKIQETKKRSR